VVILREKAVLAKTGIPRSTRALWIAQGKFPGPIKLGARAVGWVEESIEDFLRQKVQESRKSPSPALVPTPGGQTVCGNTLPSGASIKRQKSAQ
jgi:prophage regulatory protein